MNIKQHEKLLLIQRFIREDTDLYKVGKELGLNVVDKYDEEYIQHQKHGKIYFYFPYKEKDKIIEEIAQIISDEKLIEVFSRLKPRDWLNIGFKGKFFTYAESKGLTFDSVWDDVKKDIFEVLEQLGERAYAFLKAIIELHADGKWSGYTSGAPYSDILAKMREICGKPIYPAPGRDFPILKSYRVYYKSGSRKYPSHSIPEEIIPIVKEALDEWKK